ncbi:MAG: hypothetical protein C0490_02430, partial [Marivirga sp.]|nr:hypothetical protein [Marivirga sp.]
MKTNLLVFLACIFLLSCQQKMDSRPDVQQWTTFEITLVSQSAQQNAYTDTDVWAVFKNEKGDTLVRPAFWDGGNTWKIRFAPPDTGSIWKWTTYSRKEESGLSNQSGSLKSIPYAGDNQLLKHGFLKMSPGRRNVLHADGTPFLIIGDTPWGIPFRATPEQVDVYASDRRKKGYNIALLMSVQP